MKRAFCCGSILHGGGATHNGLCSIRKKVTHPELFLFMMSNDRDRKWVQPLRPANVPAAHKADGRRDMMQNEDSSCIMFNLIVIVIM